jgi:L-cysteine:1D-myo-inositol 2-amino-2-deoxy-alpha-D-glucopyranoside ligase
MKIYDTKQSELVELSLAEIVNIYTCGITPYDAAHVGHAQVYLTFDVLQRRLMNLGHTVRIIRNITDVDDDILRKARELKVNYLDLAAEEISKFNRSMELLNIMEPYSEPRATSAIPNILILIDKLMQSGFAYSANGFIYFDSAKAENLNSISHLNESERLILARERGGNPDDINKRHPLDVVLWQPSLDDEPVWDSRFGPGRPGWHIECVALAIRESGTTTIDIHGGGSDLIFPHHECENVQALAVNNAELAKYWMHVGMVRYQGEKMSKSLGNLVFIEDLILKFDGPTVRLGLLSKHYRDSYEFKFDILNEAVERYNRYKLAATRPDYNLLIGSVQEALDIDLNTPVALEIMDNAVSEGYNVNSAMDLLGVKINGE